MEVKTKLPLDRVWGKVASFGGIGIREQLVDFQLNPTVLGISLSHFCKGRLVCWLSG